MRIKLLSPGEMSPEQKSTYDESIASKRGRPPPPMMAWLNSPEMAKHATRLGAFLRFDTVFEAKLSEIAILVTARHWTAHYEWYAHKRLALKGGMDLKIIDDIRDRRIPSFDDPKAQMLYDVGKLLISTARSGFTAACSASKSCSDMAIRPHSSRPAATITILGSTPGRARAGIRRHPALPGCFIRRSCIRAGPHWRMRCIACCR